ncbi:HNH endonuclease [Bdellovibrio sp. HCB290]|uniref:HNH endonuclease n=1 Tax=Bdellovibrio sp. HCB290 TaxID=3394356 RepID=UPI0039B62496
MNLKALNQNELDLRIKSLAQKEREVLHEVLETLKEIDARKSYLNFGFSSLFEYLVHGVGYSEGSAQRRIDAARLLRELPGVAEKIQTGEINLSQISLVQKAAREVIRTRAASVTAEQKMEVLENLGKKSYGQTQQQVAAFFDLPIAQGTYKKVHADESVRVEFTLTKEAFAKIKNAQEILSHAVPTQDLAVFLEYLADKVIKQKAGRTKENAPVHKANFESKDKMPNIANLSELDEVTANVAVNITDRSLTSANKRIIFKKQPCCQWVDPQSGRRCESKWLLQIDHKQSRWAQGSNQLGNLQVLCAAHNKLKYMREAGIRNIS